MADKSVIQMTAEAHWELGSAALISALHVRKLESTVVMSTEEAASYAAGFDAAWKLSALCILREGNAKFERSE
jgi:hypothetical protein